MGQSDTAEDNKGRNRLGERLLCKNIITHKQLKDALRKQEETGLYLGEILIREGIAPPEAIYDTLSEQLGIPYVDVASVELDPRIVSIVPEKLARRFNLVPLSLENETLTIAIADHLDIVALDTIASNTGYRVQAVLSSREKIGEAIDRCYSRVAEIEEDLQEIVGVEEAEGTRLPVEELEMEASDAPVVRFVNLLLNQAIEQRASDLHIEPGQDKVRVRARIDGVLYRMTPPSKAMLPAVVTRIKILSGMDIGERRLPQDGRCKLERKNIDIRVSTLPTIYGEKVVMRLLDKSRLVLDLSELGLEEGQQACYEEALRRPQGIILVTGPTGSGKTTTLYSGLCFIRSEENNIVTVEDPVEYELEGISQVQVKPGVGLTFASALRSILRQDPDVVMVGEIRDLETAEIAVRFALTGHLVLSTLHTKDAITSIVRLSEMGVRPYLLGSCLSLIMAQRLVRRCCEHCKEPYELAPATAEKVGLPPDRTYYRGRGCGRCNQTGYCGRLGIFEMLPVNRRLGYLIAGSAAEEELTKAARQEGMVTLRESGIQKVIDGLTTAEEVIARTME